jgi:hypothetical protein
LTAATPLASSCINPILESPTITFDMTLKMPGWRQQVIRASGGAVSSTNVQ